MVVRRYNGKHNEAAAAFQADAPKAAADGYYPTSQVWQEGSWGCGAYLIGVAAVLLFGLGLIILGYLVIVKPAGTLVVSYEFRGSGPAPLPIAPVFNDNWQR